MRPYAGGRLEPDQLTVSTGGETGWLGTVGAEHSCGIISETVPALAKAARQLNLQHRCWIRGSPCQGIKCRFHEQHKPDKSAGQGFREVRKQEYQNGHPRGWATPNHSGLPGFRLIL